MAYIPESSIDNSNDFQYDDVYYLTEIEMELLKKFDYKLKKCDWVDDDAYILELFKLEPKAEYIKHKDAKDQVRCNKCGGTKFEVTKNSYWTGIRCPECKWETCIHEG